MHTRSSDFYTEVMRNIRCAVGLLLAMPAFAMAQQPPPAEGGTLKATTEVVSIYAVVREKNGHLIPDLSKDDFVVEEDQQPQEIKYFSREADTPLTMGILVDTSPSQGRVLEEEKTQAEAFLREVLRPKDLAFVLNFDVDVTLLQDFTADLHRLDHAIDECEINGGGVRTPGTFPTGDSSGATHLYDAVWLSARDLLKNEVGRKVLIMLTDGEDQGSKVRLEAALEAAQKSDLIIYSVDIHDRGFYARAGMGYSGDSVLRKFSDATGGSVIHTNSGKGTAEAFQKIASELRTQYLLGYTPSNTKLDGTYRKIDVKVRNRPVKVSARRGYYAPEG